MTPTELRGPQHTREEFHNDHEKEVIKLFLNLRFTFFLKQNSHEYLKWAMI